MEVTSISGKALQSTLTDLKGINACRIFWDAIRSISRLLMDYIMEGPKVIKGRAHGDWEKKKPRKTEGKKIIFFKKSANRSVQLLWLHPNPDYLHIKFCLTFFLGGEVSIFCVCVQGGLSARTWSGTKGHKGLCLMHQSVITNLYQDRLISGQEAWEPDVGAATRPSWILECLRGKRLLKFQASCGRDYRAEVYQKDLFVCVLE